MTEINSKRRSSQSADRDQGIVKCKAIKAATMPMVNNCPDKIGMTTLVKMDFSKSLWQLVMKTIHDTAWSSFPTVPKFPSSEQFCR